MAIEQPSLKVLRAVVVGMQMMLLLIMFLACVLMGPNRRHIYLQNDILQECQSAGVTSHSNGAPLPELGDLPADIFLDNFGAGSPVAVDVSVVCGLQPSRSSAIGIGVLMSIMLLEIMLSMFKT